MHLISIYCLVIYFETVVLNDYVRYMVMMCVLVSSASDHVDVTLSSLRAGYEGVSPAFSPVALVVSCCRARVRSSER